MNDDGASAGSAPFRVLFICGSLRKESFNRKLIRAATKLAPAHFQISESISIGEIPHLNDDVARTAVPEPVVRLNNQIRAVDAVVIATPEYNYSIPGVLKNTLDWIPCPVPHENPLRFKPVALMGASIGNFGTTRCQMHLRQTLLFHEAYVMPKPEIYLFRALEKFDADGALTDQATIDLIKAYWPALQQYAGMVTAMRASGVA